MKYLLADIGSTHTKVIAIDLDNKKVMGNARSFTTVATDIIEGFNNALGILESQIGRHNYDKTFIASSAKGGLKMISVGLVPSITGKASKLAVTGAGAKLYNNYSYELTSSDLKEIVEINPEIVLLTGGTDGGNSEIILKNAKKLADLNGDFYIIYAGNCKCVDEIQEIFGDSSKLKITSNVISKFDKLNIEPVKKCIRELFIKNIISAKGLDKIQAICDGDIIPTPLAFMNGLEIIGSEFPKLMAFDIGGATADVYSLNDGLPKNEGVQYSGFVEPFNKRTVEGNIGMRYSISFVQDEQVMHRICTNINVQQNEVEKFIDKCMKNPDYLATTEIEKIIEQEICKMAVDLSTNMHVGCYETAYTLLGEVKVQYGKDLTNTEYVIGAGGAIVNSQNPKNILEGCTYKVSDGNLLKPIKCQYIIDKRNLISAIGLMYNENEEIILKLIEIIKNELIYLS